MMYIDAMESFWYSNKEIIIKFHELHKALCLETDTSSDFRIDKILDFLRKNNIDSWRTTSNWWENFSQSKVRLMDSSCLLIFTISSYSEIVFHESINSRNVSFRIDFSDMDELFKDKLYYILQDEANLLKKEI